MNAQQTDQPAIYGLRNAEKEFYFMMPRPCPEAGHERPEARTHGGLELAKSGHTANKERKHGGHTRGRHRGGQGEKAFTFPLQDFRQAQGGHMADSSGHMADKVWRHGQSGLQADTRRTSKLQAAVAN